MNAWEMVELLRDYVAEGTATHWSDLNLVRRLNAVQRAMATRVLLAEGDWLVKSQAVTPVASVVTLPADCVKPVRLEETSTGEEIPLRGTVRERSVGRLVGSGLTSGFLSAYRVGGTLVINADSYTEGCTLYYQQRVPDLLTGTGDTGSGSNTVVFASAVYPRRTDDYYNGVYLEVVSGTGVGTIAEITDYVASTRAATVAGTFGTDSVYGTISVLPEEAHAVVVLEAAMLALVKPGSTVDENAFSMVRALHKAANDELKALLASGVSASSYVRIAGVD